MKNIFTLSFFLLLSSQVLFGQLFPDRHNTNWFDGWRSCNTSMSPNPARGDVHWIMYDLGSLYPLGDIHIWNANVPDSTDMGLNAIIIDYSKDAVEWKELGDYQLSQVPESSTFYEGDFVGAFEGRVARYVLINVASNHGGDCTSFSELRIGVAEAALPVQLVSFDARCTESQGVSLQWETTNEINNDRFEIERSADGVSWESIGRVQAATSNSSINNYKFEDGFISESTNYYRLVQYDNDGRSTIHEITAVDCDLVISDIAIYPNPVSDKLYLKISGEENASFKVSINNAIGKEINQFSIEGNVNTPVDVSSLPAGQYYLWVNKKGLVLKEKFVKID